jgi:hypothetical protein
VKPLRIALAAAASCVVCMTAAQAQSSSAAGTASSTAQPAIPAPVTQPLPANRWTPAQIREAFQLADANSDGQLTRAEAQRLPILPRSFEDTDLNKDGVLTLDEYMASFAQ